MFYFGFLAEIALLWWVAVILLPVAIISLICSLAEPSFEGMTYSNSNRAFTGDTGNIILLALCSLALAHLLGWIDVVTFVTHDWGYLLLGAGVYLLLAFPYTRYFTWNRRLKTLYRYRAMEFKSQGKEMTAISVLDYKSVFVQMMIWWPFILLNRIFSDYIIGFLERIRDFFSWIVEKFIAYLQSDSDKMLEKLKAAEKK